MDINTSTNTRFENRNPSLTVNIPGTVVAGLYGHSRNTSTQFIYKCPQENGTAAFASQTPESRNIFLYTRSDDSITFQQWSVARIAFYSIGESLDLALLDARVTTLLSAISAAIQDPYYGNVSLLLHGNGTNGSTTITDNSPYPKTVTAVGNAQISTAQSKFGGASIAFDGTGDAATTANSSDFRLNGDFTVELWVYPNSLTADRYFVSHYDFGSAQRDWRFGLKSGSAHLYFNFVAANGATENEILAGVGLTVSTWQHIAVTKSGSTSRIFINGIQQASSTALVDLGGSTASLSVGSILNSGSPAFGANCYIDDLRITKGVARYTSNFTPPTTQFPDS